MNETLAEVFVLVEIAVIMIGGPLLLLTLVTKWRARRIADMEDGDV